MTGYDDDGGKPAAVACLETALSTVPGAILSDFFAHILVMGTYVHV